MINKQELIKKVNELPIFEFKEIFIKDDEDELNKQNKFKAIVEKGDTEALSIVTDRYRLVQFKEVLLPIIENLGDLEGNTYIRGGEGYTIVLPEDEKEEKFGLMIFNSVTKKFPVLIDFIVCFGDNYVVIPNKVKKFQNRHIGNVKEIVEDYEAILTSVKSEWKIISEKFNRILTPEEYNYLLGELKLGKRINNNINELYDGKEVKLWNFLLETIKNIQERKYKNEVNKMRKIKFISEIIFKFALIESLK